MNKAKRKLTIIDCTDPLFVSGKYHSAFGPQVTFRVLAAKFESERIKIRAKSREDIYPDWRTEFEELLVFHGEPESELRLLLKIEDKIRNACQSAERYGKCEGQVTEVSIKKQIDRYEKLLSFRSSTDDSEEKLEKIKSKLAELKQSTADAIYSRFVATTTRCIDKDNLSSEEAKLVSVLEDNGGSIATAVLDEFDIKSEVMQSLCSKNLCNQTKDGVIRIVI